MDNSRGEHRYSPGIVRDAFEDPQFQAWISAEHRIIEIDGQRYDPV
jgi:hypothetical protein